MPTYMINYTLSLTFILSIMSCGNNGDQDKYELKGACLEAYHAYVDTFNGFDHQENTIKIEQAKKQTKIRLSKTSEEQCRNILTALTESAK